MEKPNQVFLFLSHHASGQVVREYKNIRSATAGIGSSIFLYHHKSNNAPPALPTRNLYLFSDESLSKLNYRMIGPTLVPGHVGFPVLQFFCDNPDFDYYWAIEYDVRFSGDWFFFFDSFREANYDFLACHLRDYVDEPDWPRWTLDHPRKSIALRERLRCFNPIFRLTNAALSFLHRSLLDGWCGHNEVLFPTLLHRNGFAIADMGGKGRFRPLDLRENFYTESEANSIGLLDSGTMRYRPPFLRVGREKNKLYHPVKPLSSTLREKISRQCHRWLPSSLVQMLKKMRNTSSAQL